MFVRGAKWTVSALTGAYSLVRGGECAILAVMKEFAIPAVKAAIFRLREIQAKAFGSEEHGFQINPVLPESEASAFEQDHKIVLPSDYRWQFCSWFQFGPARPVLLLC